MTTKLKEGKVYFTPVQEGTGDPSPDNVRPIHGWDSLTVTKCGKNLYSRDDGKPVYMPFKAGTTISVRGYFRVIMYDSDLNQLGYFSLSSNVRTVTLTYDVSYIGFYPEQTGHQYQIELNTEPTAYEPYTETTITIPFPQTIYGGYVDLIKGELVDEWKKLTLTTSNTTVRSTSNMQYPYYMRTQITGWKYGTNALISDVLASTQTNAAFRSTLAGWQMPNVSNIIYWVHPDCATESGAESLRTSEEFTIMYKLATPITHTIDPQVIRPFKGVNNIWSDANGSIEVKFWTH